MNFYNFYTRSNIDAFLNLNNELSTIKERFEANPTLRAIYDINYKDGRRFLLYDYYSNNLDFIIIGFNDIMPLLDEINFQYEFENDHIVIRNMTADDYMIVNSSILSAYDIEYNSFVELLIEKGLGVRAINEYDPEYYEELMRIHPLLAYRHIETRIYLFDILIDLLINRGHVQSEYYQLILELGERYLESINGQFEGSVTDLIDEVKEVCLEWKSKNKWKQCQPSELLPQYPAEAINKYAFERDTKILDLPIKWVDGQWLSYNEKYEQINYYLALILYRKPGENFKPGILTEHERRQLMKYLLLSGNEDEPKRLRQEVFAEYMGYPIRGLPIEINFDPETIINLATMLKR